MKERGTIDTASSYGVAGVLAAIVICAGLSGTGFYIAIGGSAVRRAGRRGRRLDAVAGG